VVKKKAEASETGVKWWVRYAVIPLLPLISGGGLLAWVKYFRSPEPPATPTGSSASTPSPAAPGIVQLQWVPSACGDREVLAVGVGTCNDRRTMEWLTDQFATLASFQIRGFDKVPAKPSALYGETYDGKKNQLLRVKPTMGGGTWYVSVGYNRDTNGQDGCLRLYDESMRLASEVVCWTTTGNWSVKNGDSYRPVR
jgi:hypothetical protein